MGAVLALDLLLSCLYCLRARKQPYVGDDPNYPNGCYSPKQAAHTLHAVPLTIIAQVG